MTPFQPLNTSTKPKIATPSPSVTSDAIFGHQKQPLSTRPKPRQQAEVKNGLATGEWIVNNTTADGENISVFHRGHFWYRKGLVATHKENVIRYFGTFVGRSNVGSE